MLLCDLAERYGLDEEAPVMWDRSWPWLRRRIIGLLALPDTRLTRLLSVDREEGV